MLSLAITFIISACFFYTISIWTEKIIKRLKPRIVIIFGLGFILDLTGTLMMFFQEDNSHVISSHSIWGYAALLVMLLHLIWAILAQIKKGNYQKYFTKCSLIAWLIWLLAFITGLPKMN